MQLPNLFKKNIPHIALDIGSTSIRFVELDMSTSKPSVLKYGIFPITGDVFTGHTIVNTKKISDIIAQNLTDLDLSNKRVVFAVPGPSVFTKHIKVPRMVSDELTAHVQLEAGNFIPQNLSSVRIDYDIVQEVGKNQYEVLVVAAKADILDSFVQVVTDAGLTPGIADVDYFAMQNAFEANYPDYKDKYVILINIGARFASINICYDGKTLFTGDLSIGGRQITEQLSEKLECSIDEAEKLKHSGWAGHARAADIAECVREYVQNVTAELHRQISFFWNATGVDAGIDAIFVSGGAALIPGFIDALAERTELPCEALDPFKLIDRTDAEIIGKGSDRSTHFAVAVGLALRQKNDKRVRK